MSTTPIIAPRLGEGLHTVKLIKYLKNKGDYVERDECIVLVETDKAIMEIESPATGIIENWKYEIKSEIPVGQEIGVINSVQPHVKQTVSQELCGEEHTFNQLKEKVNLMRSKDLAGRFKNKRHRIDENVIHFKSSLEKKEIEKSLSDNEVFKDQKLSNKQTKFISNLGFAAESVVQATLTVECDWLPIRNLKTSYRRDNSKSITPTSTEVISWCIVQAVKIYPQLRSLYLSPSTIREFHDTNIGIAVALPNDDLETAVIAQSNKLDFNQFVNVLRNKISDLKNGKMHPGYCSILISDLSLFGITYSTPIVVYPSVATVTINVPKKYECGKELFLLSMTFDHRIINGAGAAKFLNTVKEKIKNLTNSDFTKIAI